MEATRDVCIRSRLYDPQYSMVIIREIVFVIINVERQTNTGNLISIIMVNILPEYGLALVGAHIPSLCINGTNTKEVTMLISGINFSWNLLNSVMLQFDSCHQINFVVYHLVALLAWESPVLPVTAKLRLWQFWVVSVFVPKPNTEINVKSNCEGLVKNLCQ